MGGTRIRDPDQSLEPETRTGMSPRSKLSTRGRTPKLESVSLHGHTTQMSNNAKDTYTVNPACRLNLLEFTPEELEIIQTRALTPSLASASREEEATQWAVTGRVPCGRSGSQGPRAEEGASLKLVGKTEEWHQFLQEHVIQPGMGLCALSYVYS